MALQKEIQLDNGIILNYHRIKSFNKITNQSNIIEVNSYINETQREKEKEYERLQEELINLQNTPEEYDDIDIEEQEKRKEEKIKQIKELKKEIEKGINVLIEAEFINISYDANMTIQDAYEYLKTTKKYKDAIDV